MISLDKAFEKDCEEYLSYLAALAANKYNDCPDIDSIIQETMLAFIIKRSKGQEILHPKGFLAAIFKNKYNAWLRGKYKGYISIYDYANILESENEIRQKEEAELQKSEYEAVRREIGRLIRIYREVAVRFYIHGHSVARVANELDISVGTVKSRLSNARSQIKEGLNKKMEKYSGVSYEPKSVSIGIWGNTGLEGEPFSLVSSEIEENILYLAYEKPISIREIADTLGMPCAFVEPLIDKLVNGELMGVTDGGLVFSRCFMQQQSDSFGDIGVQEALADKNSEKVWEVVWKYLEPLTTRVEFAGMTEKQKATLFLYVINNCIGTVTRKSEPAQPDMIYPDRPNGGRWFAIATVSDGNQVTNKKYRCSGPVCVTYSKNYDGIENCRMFDFQSTFGDAHWAYGRFKYKCGLQSILRFYASLLPCDVSADNSYMAELVPEFEKLNIIKRLDNGEIMLDVPALTYDESALWSQAMMKIEEELFTLLKDELKSVWESRVNKIPKYVDGYEHFLHAGALEIYNIAQTLAIVNKGLLPYPVEIGKTPIIFVVYKKAE